MLTPAQLAAIEALACSHVASLWRRFLVTLALVAIAMIACLAAGVGAIGAILVLIVLSPLLLGILVVIAVRSRTWRALFGRPLTDAAPDLVWVYCERRNVVSRYATASSPPLWTHHLLVLCSDRGEVADFGVPASHKDRLLREFQLAFPEATVGFSEGLAVQYSAAPPSLRRGPARAPRGVATPEMTWHRSKPVLIAGVVVLFGGVYGLVALRRHFSEVREADARRSALKAAASSLGARLGGDVPACKGAAYGPLAVVSLAASQDSGEGVALASLDEPEYRPLRYAVHEAVFWRRSGDRVEALYVKWDEPWERPEAGAASSEPCRVQGTLSPGRSPESLVVSLVRPPPL